MRRNLELIRTSDHSREALGMTYVYAVDSRRAGGISLGVNLNPNNACNWRCIYCQVPGLQKGSAPLLDLALLRTELEAAVAAAEAHSGTAPASAELKDIAISGNGEPTTSKQFGEAIEVIREVLAARGLLSQLKVVLITNGSQIDKARVLSGLEVLGRMNGEIWFKLDAVTSERRRLINDTTQSSADVARCLELASRHAPTRIQTCLLTLDGEPPDEAEQVAYVDFLRTVLASGTKLADVTLYGPDRKSQQPEAARIGKVDPEWLAGFARRIAELGLPVLTHG